MGEDRRRLRGEESRQSIIKGAIESIARRGLSGTTLETVAARAKVSRSLVIFHFKSKNGLHIEVLNYLGAQFSAGWDAILADEELPPNQRVIRLLEYDVRFAIEHPKYVAVWHAVWGEAKGSTLYREVSFPRDTRYMEDVRSLLLDLADQDSNGTVDIAAIIKGLDAMVFGLWRQAHINPTPDHGTVAMRAIHVFLAAWFPQYFAVN
jgi:TetR/AcrR family transcriptional repressor of bet genes